MNVKAIFTLSMACLLASCGGGTSSSNASSADTSGQTSAASSSNATSNPTSSASQGGGSSAASTLPEIDHIRVFAPKLYTHVWAWTKDGSGNITNLFDSWPGVQLQSWDATWNTYEFVDYTSLWIIFNNGSDAQKTADHFIPSKGYWWYSDGDWTQNEPSQQTSSSAATSSAADTSYEPYNPPAGDLDNKHRTWYQLLVYSFADGDGDGIGDFKGLVDHLDYLKNLGVGGIWLSPCHPSADYHGYDVKDYYSIDSKYERGGVNFAKLIEECHKKDIRVLMDMVLNHTSDQHPWTWEHRDWYSGEHVFSGSMPDLNYDNQEVRAEIKKIGKYWLDKGVDGFRCDGAAWIYGGGGGWNIEQNTFQKTIEWWTEYASYLKGVKSDVYLVGECWTDLQYVEQFFSSGMSAFNFSASYWAKDSMNNGAPAKWVEECVGHQQRVRQKDPNGIEASFLSNHDTGRYASQGGDKGNLMLANALNVISPGGSFIYYGDELGMTGDAGGWTDQGYRTPMPFSSGRTNGDAYMWRSANSNTVSGQSADSDASNPSSMYTSLANVVKFKNANPMLYGAQVSQINVSNNVGIMKYAGASESFYLVLNTTGNKQTVNVSGSFEKAFTFDSNGQVNVSSSSIELPGRSFAFLKAGGDLSFSI